MMTRSMVLAGAKTTCSVREPGLGEDDVGDLLVFAVGFAGVVVDGVDLDGLAEGVLVARGVEGGLAGAEFFDQRGGGEAVGQRRGIERAEAALLRCCGRAVSIWDRREGMRERGR